MTLALRFPILLGIILLGAELSTAQVQTGTPPFGSSSGGPFDTVDLANLNVHFTIPVFSRAGRGIPFNYNLQYDTSVWYPVTVSGTTTWNNVPNWGLLAQTASMTGKLSVTITGGDCWTYISYNHTWVLTGNQTYYSWNSYFDPWGTPHPLSVTSSRTWGNCNGVPVQPSQDVTVTASDGSGYTLKTASANPLASYAMITAKEGTVSYPPWNGDSGASGYT